MSSWLAMWRLILLYCTFVFGLLFLVTPDYTRTVTPFLFSDMQLSLATHIYFICEKLTMVILAYVIYNEATTYRSALLIFLLLIVADLADYLLSYSSIWFSVGTIPVSINTVKCLIFGLTILYTWTKNQLYN